MSRARLPLRAQASRARRAARLPPLARAPGATAASSAQSARAARQCMARLAGFALAIGWTHGDHPPALRKRGELRRQRGPDTSCLKNTYASSHATRASARSIRRDRPRVVGGGAGAGSRSARLVQSGLGIVGLRGDQAGAARAGRLARDRRATTRGGTRTPRVTRPARWSRKRSRRARSAGRFGGSWTAGVRAAPRAALADRQIVEIGPRRRQPLPVRDPLLT